MARSGLQKELPFFGLVVKYYCTGSDLLISLGFFGKVLWREKYFFLYSFLICQPELENGQAVSTKNIKVLRK